MNRKRWTLLVLCILLLVGYFKFFYKTWSNDAVTKNADCIIALDVKRITNTLIWNFITTPSQWKKISFFSSSTQTSWEDMVKLPDYVFVFHNAGEPVAAWYTVLEIKDEADFEKGLEQFHFVKSENNRYTSAENGIEFIRNGNRVVVGNASVSNKDYIQQAAANIFTRQYIQKEKLKTTIDARSHASLYTMPNGIFKNALLARINFDKEQLNIRAGLPVPMDVHLVTNTFAYSDTSLCTLAFTQPEPGLESLIEDSARASVSKALNFNIDSFFRPGNLNYTLDVEGIHARIDSAVSYEYDDNFNPVEKVVMNRVEEPAFNFTANGVQIENAYSYLLNNNKLEQTAQGALFTPIPFVKSYCKVEPKKSLDITANNYKTAKADKKIECILFFKLLLSKLPASLRKYLPGSMMKYLKNIETMKAEVTNEKGAVLLNIDFNKKKNDLPLIDL